MNEMWAVQYGRYGGPEVLTVGRVPMPKASASQVLVEVAAFSVNQADLAARTGKMKGLMRSRVSLEDAAALPLVGLTAIQALRALRVEAGKRVLIVGGNGGVGSTAIQVARALGATVDAVSGHHHETAQRAGAAHIYNYHDGGTAQISASYDAILEAACVELFAYRGLLNRRGRIAPLSPAAMPAILASAFTPGPMIRMVSAKPDAGDLAWLAAQANEGTITPIIDTGYPLGRVGDAHQAAEEHSAAGKRVISVRAQ